MNIGQEPHTFSFWRACAKLPPDKWLTRNSVALLEKAGFVHVHPPLISVHCRTADAPWRMAPPVVYPKPAPRAGRQNGPETSIGEKMPPQEGDDIAAPAPVAMQDQAGRRLAP